MEKVNNKSYILLKDILDSIELYKNNKINYWNLYTCIDADLININIKESKSILLLIEKIRDINSYIDVLIGLKEGDENYNLSYKEKEEINKNNNIIISLIHNFLKNATNSDILINNDGIIVKSNKYTSYSIYIDQDTDTKEYTIYLWKKDSNEDGLEFKIKNKEELQKFFEDNDILVEWEENENS